jgi:hypothetical protein
MNRGIFTLSTEDMGRLGPAEAVQAFRELLWADATALSIAKTLIDVPVSVTARMLHCKTRPRVCHVYVKLFSATR